MRKFSALLLMIALSAISARGQGSDNADNYTNGWVSGSNNGTGFAAWTLANSTNDAGQNGEFLGDSTNNGGNTNGTGINSPITGKAFGLYANSGQTASASRPLLFASPLAVGQTFSIDFENGFINGGGTVGIGLQDPSGNNRLEFFFIGGQTAYTIQTTNGITTGIPFTDTGLHLTFTLASADSINVTITGLNGNTNSFTTNGIPLEGTLGSAIAQVRLFNFNSGGGAPNNAFYNNLALTVPPSQLGGFDIAGNYTNGWTNGSSAGAGFGAWSFGNTTNDLTQNNEFLGDSTTNGGAGHAGINSPTTGQAFGLTASNGQTASANRSLANPLSIGQTFTMDFENGFINGGGTVGFALQDAGGNSRVEFFFVGGTTDYIVQNTNGAGGIDTHLGFTGTGLQVAFTLASADTMNVAIYELNGNASFFRTNGIPLEGISGAAITQVRLFDFNGGTGTQFYAFYNNLALSASSNPTLTQISAIQLTGSNVVVTAPSVNGQSYQLQSRSSLTSGNWSNVVGATVTGTGSAVTLTNFGGATQSPEFYRIDIGQ